MKRFIALLLLLLLPSFAVSEQGAFLTSEDLKALQPTYETFLQSMADRLILRGLLLESERDAWILYQRGDFLQNGGYGAIATLYTPGLLSMADESVAMRTLSVETEIGIFNLETLRRYSVSYSTLPGLPLDDVELLDQNGDPVDCRYRWIVPYGSLMIWDGVQEEMVDVGASYINDGKPLFWQAEPVDGIDEALTLELLSRAEDQLLATITLIVVSGPDFWSPEVLR